MTTSPAKSLQQMHPKRVDIFLLTLVSMTLFWIALKLPILTVQKLWEQNTFSIMGGIQNLWTEGNRGLASIIFFFSIVFPIVKLVMLLIIWFVKMTDRRRRWILYVLEALGRWSMLDVFVVAVLMVSMKLGVLATAKIEKGIYYFGAAILTAMLATALASYLARRTAAGQAS